MGGRKFLSYLVRLQIVLAVLFAVPAWAQLPHQESDKALYIQLLQDFYDEVRTMDAVRGSIADRETFIRDFQIFITHQELPNPAAVSGASWSGMWPPAPVTDVPAKQAPHAIENILSSILFPVSQHSLSDPQNYAAQRLGPMLARMLQHNQLKAIVYGGDIESMMSQGHFQAQDVFHIPSFYESWGLTKYLISGKAFRDGQARVVITVPPSRQYLQHYATMLAALHAKSVILLDLNDQSHYRQMFEHAIQIISSGVGHAPDYAMLGYYNQWVTSLKDESSAWRILETSPVVYGGQGLSGRNLQVQNKQSGKILNFLLLKSDLTIWGESSAFIAESLMNVTDKSLKGMIFLGSAGGIAKDLQVYSVSVPKAFSDGDGSVSTTNFLQQVNTSGDSSVRFDLQHGNSFSPIQQDVSFLGEVQDQGVGAIDVEQSLIARAVAEHNSIRSTNIKFGAVNIVTDLPGLNLTGEESKFHLDNIDLNAKFLSREKAVGLALHAIGVVETPADLGAVRSCASALE